MNDSSENMPAQPVDLAREVMFAAAKLAAAVLRECMEKYPTETAIVANAGTVFSVKVTDILAAQCRVSIIHTIAGEEYEMFFSELTAANPPGKMLN